MPEKEVLSRPHHTVAEVVEYMKAKGLTVVRAGRSGGTGTETVRGLADDWEKVQLDADGNESESDSGKCDTFFLVLVSCGGPNLVSFLVLISSHFVGKPYG
jgi:hypothetical protein